MTTAHFQNLSEIICRHLSEARQHIRIAVCWFSHKDIFDTLLARLRAGVQVELLLEYDSQNIHDAGLDFQQFIRRDGHLYAHLEAGLMHHKFALVDERLLLTGSFNWTYNSNAENLLVTDDATMTLAFREEFERQKAIAKRIFTVRRADVKVFSAFPLFENTEFQLAGLRKKVSSGAGVWLVRLDKLKVDKSLIFKENYLPFDSAGLLQPYWSAYRMWDEKLFGEEMEGLKTKHSVPVLRDLHRWARRMKIGDIVLATERKTKLVAVGIIQSHPQPFTG
ncbi:MAG TPA: phospholipase D-like domain-containing protein, partial [Saprospiraceae bacterium]|nr:phospholipase D-like domain-containing protein [Saprospiraceae bacterium]